MGTDLSTGFALNTCHSCGNAYPPSCPACPWCATAWPGEEVPDRRRPRLALVGPAKCGKDLAAVWVTTHTTLRSDDLVVGVQDKAELEAVRGHGLVDLVVWIDRPVPWDEGLDFGATAADVVILNRTSRSSFHAKLERLARAMGILRGRQEP